MARVHVSRIVGDLRRLTADLDSPRRLLKDDPGITLDEARTLTDALVQLAEFVEAECQNDRVPTDRSAKNWTSQYLYERLRLPAEQRRPSP